jgi:hydroxyquinol 1,2-dioxygenase
MKNVDQNTITQTVLARMGDMPDARLKTILTSLVHHLHDFARDVKLSEEEWMHAIQFLTRTGQKCDDKRQEFILLSDVLGLSMLTVAMNNQKPPGCTEATVFGPFFVEDAPEVPLGGDVAQGAAGQPCTVSGRVMGSHGQAVAHAQLEVWQADEEGFYDVQRPELHAPQARARLQTDSEGRFHFKTIVAEAYPIPTDGPVGELLRATGRHPWRPAHLHFMIKAPGFETLITHVFRNDDQYLESDAVFGVRESLIADWVKQPNGHTQLHFDFVLNESHD